MRQKKPNIVFFLSDDQGYYSLGNLHTSELKTPNLDGLAEKGIRFSEFFCASPVCSPARASILTGCIPSCHGIHDWIRAGNLCPDNFELSQDIKEKNDYLIEKNAIPYLEGQITYTDILAREGYQCALSGKWHLGDSVTPQHGFTKWFTIGKGGCSYMAPDIVENGEIIFEKQYVTDLITDKAVGFVQELSKQDTPFYLSVNYTAPHAPWDASNHPQKYLDMYGKCEYDKYYPQVEEHPWSTPWSRRQNTKREESFRGYEASITAMDEGIGRVIQELKAQGIYENTILIFTSDNGFNMGHHGFFGKGNGTYPLNVYEESIRVPFIISCPQFTHKNIILSGVHSHYDVFPTILELADIQYKKTEKQPGNSFVDELEKGINREGGNTIIFDEYGGTRMIRTTQYKYVHRFVDGPHELYDLFNDSGEVTNLYGVPEYATIVLQLRKQLFQWFCEYSLPEKDGTKESVTGLGQLCKCSYEADQIDSFYPRED